MYANIENFQKITTSFKSAKVVAKEPDTEIVEVEAEVMGRRGKGKIKRRYFQNERVEEEMDNDFAVGTQTFTFSDVPEGTKVTLFTDVTPKGAMGKIFGGLAKGRLRKFIDDEMETGKKYIEANKPA